MKLNFKELKPMPPQDKRPHTIVFIDYEYLYISFNKLYFVSPPLDKLIEDIKICGMVTKICVFGDFSNPPLSQERNSIRTITSNIIDCANQSTKAKKNYTDFIMLDHIYQELIQNPSVEQFIFFTGDGHFSSAATFLRNFMDKTIGVYGIANSISRQLKDCSSWTKEVFIIEDDERNYQINLLKNLKTATERGLYPTFIKTIEITQYQFSGDYYRYQQVLQDLVDDGYVSRELITVGEKEFMTLVVDWERVKNELGISV